LLFGNDQRIPAANQDEITGFWCEGTAKWASRGGVGAKPIRYPLADDYFPLSILIAVLLGNSEPQWYLSTIVISLCVAIDCIVHVKLGNPADNADGTFTSRTLVEKISS
jgi:hypothetical protein